MRTAQRRGAVEHYFQASPRSFIGHQDWRRVPRSLLGNVSSASIQSFMDKVVAAAEAGTIDGREDTKLSWMPIVVDQTGWEQAGKILDEAVARLQGVHEQSKQRLAQSGGDGTTTIIGFAGFEAAKRRRLAGSRRAADAADEHPGAEVGAEHGADLGAEERLGAEDLGARGDQRGGVVG